MYQTLASLARTRVVFADKKETGNSIRPLQVLLLLPPPICEVNLPLALSGGRGRAGGGEVPGRKGREGRISTATPVSFRSAAAERGGGIETREREKGDKRKRKVSKARGGTIS